jgi:hypothetical protein
VELATMVVGAKGKGKGKGFGKSTGKGKGTFGNAWQQKEQEKARFQKAQTLRKYAKLCKAEGVESSRVNLGYNKKKSVDNEKELTDGSRGESSGKMKYSTYKLHKAKAEGDDKADKIQRTKHDLESKIRGIEESIKKRKQLKKDICKKTSKGQPVMKGRITHILGKLMKDAEQKS